MGAATSCSRGPARIDFHLHAVSVDREEAEMTWQTWLFYRATDGFAYLVPGPAVLLVVSQALSRGALRTSWAIIGILVAEVMYFILSATSVAALLVASYDVF